MGSMEEICGKSVSERRSMKADNYLDIAETVLRIARRPLSAKAIMESAHRGGIVPSRLFGKTQHKTLQARLSEDILQYKLESKFYRTDPGLFFLSELRSDPSIPDKYKDPFHARRRARDLEKPAALALARSFLISSYHDRLSWKDLLQKADREGALRHIDPKSQGDEFALVWAFSIVRRGNEILSYRIGKYRDKRDAFANRKSIGFSEMVNFDNHSFFSDDLGVADCGLNAVMTDLELSHSSAKDGILRPTIAFAIIDTQSTSGPAVLFVMEWECPEWFEPTARRLSLNEVRWIDANHKPNDPESFEPWSHIALELLIERSNKMKFDGKENQLAASCIFSL